MPLQVKRVCELLHRSEAKKEWFGVDFRPVLIGGKLKLTFESLDEVVLVPTDLRFGMWILFIYSEEGSTDGSGIRVPETELL